MNSCFLDIFFNLDKGLVIYDMIRGKENFQAAITGLKSGLCVYVRIYVKLPYILNIFLFCINHTIENCQSNLITQL
jgi:hypothetical protein